MKNRLAVGYGRISADDRDGNTTHERQLEIVETYTKKHSLELTRFIDIDILTAVSGEEHTRNGLNDLYLFLKSNPEVKDVVN